MKAEEILEKVIEAMEDPVLREGLRRGVNASVPAVIRALTTWPNLTELADYVRKRKEEVLKNIDYYINETLKSIEERAKAKAYFASSREDVLRTVDSILGDGKKIIVKAKSMVTEEVMLREHLAERGHEVYETDLGELMIQIAKDKPMHVIAPAVHLTRERAVDILKSAGVEVTKDMKHEEIVSRVRTFLRDKFMRADIGISGANSIAADTGAIFLVFNEGNISLATTLPLVHIAVVSIEKIMPTTMDAFAQTLVQSGYAGLFPPTYIYMIAGPSSTADIEYHRVYGVHGPKELHVILYDGGRKNALNDQVLREQLFCVKCGRCEFACPIWNVSGNIWGGKVYGGPLGLAWTAITEGIERAAPLSMLCLLDGACREVCPMSIDIPKIARYLKNRYVRESRK
ncbi:MAG: LUD domain-containing protein [Candidatus Methanodesulfokora sp.]